MHARKITIILIAALVIGAALVVDGSVRPALAATYKWMTNMSATRVRISSVTTKNRKKLEQAMAKRRKAVQKQRSITNYFQYLTDGSLKAKSQYASTQQPLVLYHHASTTAAGGESGSVTPVKITKEQFLADAPQGPMYAMVNWWCSAAADHLSYSPNTDTSQYLGLFSGDCTNSNAFITGNFDSQRLGMFDPTVPLTFTLRNVDPEDATIIQKLSTDPGECDIDYYKSLGHRDVYAAQYSCDDGYLTGVRDDIQFTVYVFPVNWPEGPNVDAVLKKQSSDEDKDGLIRRLELQLGTNPSVADTDKDGVKDGDEFLAYQTNPLVADTDGDGVKDGVEIAQKMNPLGPGSATAAQLERWARLKDTAKPVLSNLAVSFTGTQAVVSWSTDLTADGIVNWGETSKYGSHKSDFAFTKSHAIAFSVSAGKTYHYAVRACSIGPNAKCTTTPNFVFDVPVAVATPPTISDVEAEVEGGYATVTWETNVDTDGSVSMGTSTSYGMLASSNTYSTDHAISIPVTAGTTYHYRIQSCTRDTICVKTTDATFSVAAATPETVAAPTIPTISDVEVSFDNGYATVSWETDLYADGIVNWGMTSAYGSHQSDISSTKSHAIEFAVTAGTTYHYAIRACTPSGFCMTTSDETFSSPGTAPVAPTLSDITIVVNGHFASVYWTTDVDADGIINYGTTTAYGRYVSVFDFVKAHGFQIYFPTTGTTYHYAIRACTKGSLCTTTADATIDVP